MRKVAGGLSGAVDLAVDAHGKVYVAELFGDRISVIRHRRVRTFVKVPTPGAVEVDRRGVVYATTNVFNEYQTPGHGTVVRITRRHRRHHLIGPTASRGSREAVASLTAVTSLADAGVGTFIRGRDVASRPVRHVRGRLPTRRR